MTGPGPEVVAGHRFDALLEVIDLTSFVFCRLGDLPTADDELRCAACESVLCDIEPDDDLAMLVNVAIAHLACCTNR